MEVISESLGKAISFMRTIGIADFLDIIIVAYLIYKAILFVRKTNSFNLAKGLIVFVVALWLSDECRLTMINFLLRRAAELGLIALLILFQPELRRLLERMGSGLPTGKSVESTIMSRAIAQTVLACKDMSDSRTGALIIFERKVALNNYMSTGTIINADATAELIKNIFFNKAPLHDGALMIRDGRLEAAGCVLPLTQSTNLSKDLGMRHRAGIGLSEQSDAIIVIVSEETGAISVAIEGMLKRHLTPASLDKLLRAELIQDEDMEEKHNLSYYLRKVFKVNGDEQK